jgi:glutamine---fructose-6-phosphate transaminase (isomerizing)
MCGIVAYKGFQEANSLVIDGLKRLEYRGYDSWGIAWINDGGIKQIKRIGRVGDVKDINTATSNLAIAHTRWATHGGVEERNAHPHLSNDCKIAVVHNGIIENHSELKVLLKSKGYSFKSETDTEVIPILIQSHMTMGKPFMVAFKHALLELEGSYALVAINNEEKSIAFGRRGSPLCVGVGDREFFAASDVSAFLEHVRDVIYIDDDEYGFYDNKLTIKGIHDEKERVKEPIRIDWNSEMASKQGFSHYMLKEIYEQPRVVEDTLFGRMGSHSRVILNLDVPSEYLKRIQKITMVACGTAMHACLVAKYMAESLTGVPVEVDYASEFRYRSNTISKDELFVFISQSGETADTLAALRKAKASGGKVLSLVNVVGSTIARESDYVFYTRAGPEIGVASTKAFASQLTSIALISLHLAVIRGPIDEAKVKDLFGQLKGISSLVDRAIKSNADEIKRCAKIFSGCSSFLFVGRNINYPIALEGALKLKEISYIHAEGFPAGELKHGPIALVDENIPSVCIATESETYKKMLSNIQEIRARNGPIISVATEGDVEVKNLSDHVFYVGKVDEALSPILTVLPLQLFAFYMAFERGCDIDKPKNLAKSVTVE